MAMSANVARALEQVKMGLAILYGANCITEDEWITIDRLIRNVQYGPARGPTKHILDEPLISFPDSKDEAKDDVNIQHAGLYPSKTLERDAIIISEKQTHLPVCSEPAAPTQFPAGAPSGPFAETPSDEGKTILRSIEPAGQPHHQEQAKTSSGNITSPDGKLPNCADDKFDQLKWSNAELTKDGWQSSSRSASVENSEKETDSPEPVKASKGELQTHSPESDVGTKDLASLEVELLLHSKSWNQPPHHPSAGQFTRISDKPKNIDDSCEANTPGHLVKRPGSRTSNTVTRTPKSLADSSFAHSASSSEDVPSLPLELTPGTILVAQSSFPKKAKVHVDVQSGDSIKIIKKVSGIMYLGENLRTKHCGQVPSSVFQKWPQARKKNSPIEHHTAIAEPKTLALLANMTSSSSSVGNDLDKVEGMNAAEWDKDDASIATAPVSLSRHELVGREHSVLANLEDQSQGSEPNEQEVMRAMMNKMIDEKLQKIQKVGRKATTSNRVSSCHSEARNPWSEPLKPVPPKTQICWFYATPNKECRFTDEECRDRHEFYSNPGDSLNLRMGKPTWGALADPSPLSPNEPVADPKGRTKTCWYWANTKCTYTADSCRFLHEHVSAGVMPRPGDWKENGKREREREREGEGVLVDVKDEPNNGLGEGITDWIDQEDVESEWVESPSERYKPPHIKALEEKAKLQSAGWW